MTFTTDTEAYEALSKIKTTKAATRDDAVILRQRP